MGAVDALLESLSVVPPGYEKVMYTKTIEALGDAEPSARREGRGLELEGAIDRALEMIG